MNIIISGGIFSKKDFRTNKNNNPMHTQETTEMNANRFTKYNLKKEPVIAKNQSSDKRIIPVVLNMKCKTNGV